MVERPAAEGGRYTGENNPRRRPKAAPTRETQEHRLKPMLPVAMCVSGLDVGFDEPEVFVHFAGDAGEEVDGDGVVEVVGFLDGGA